MHGEEKSNRKREDEKSEWVRITPTINPSVVKMVVAKLAVMKVVIEN